MTFEIPSSFGGIDGKEAYERIVNQKEEPKKSQIIQPKNKKDTNDFIYVPSINLYVAKERTLLGKNWFKCQEQLHENNEKMPTILELIEFLKYTRENHKYIYNEITKKRDPWSAEWLDADFKLKGRFKLTGRDLYINYHIFDENGKIIQKSEVLDKDTLMRDKSISLDDWVENHTSQGMPTKKIKSGNLNYWHPRKNDASVSKFIADSDRAYLICDGEPSLDNSIRGVRAVRSN